VALVKANRPRCALKKYSQGVYPTWILAGVAYKIGVSLYFVVGLDLKHA